MACDNCVTYRAMQNPDTPNLPFAQVENSPMWSGTINPDRPDLPFAQNNLFSSSNRAKGVYIVYWLEGGETELSLSQSIVDFYRNQGHRVELKSSSINTGVKPPSSPHWTKDEIETILKNYYGDDILKLHTNISKAGIQMNKNWDVAAKERRAIETKYQKDINQLYKIHKEQESRITNTMIERDRIEAKVDEAKAEHQNIWDSLGEKAGKGHSHGGKDCGWFGEKCWFPEFPELPSWLIPAAIAGGIYIVIRKRKRR